MTNAKQFRNQLTSFGKKTEKALTLIPQILASNVSAFSVFLPRR